MAANQAPYPFSLIRAASITPAAQQSLLTQSSQDLSDFVWPEEDRPTIPHNDYRRDRELPVINLAPLSNDASPATKLILARRIATACSDWGFFQFINHNIPLAHLDAVQTQTRRFFEQPLELKQRAQSLDTANASNVFGYGLNTTGYKYSGRPWIERFQCSWSPHSNLQDQAQRLLSPPAAASFISAVEAFCKGCESLANLTLELCALGLDLEPSTFAQFMNPSQSMARLNYYPACPTPDKTLGLGAHTDPYTLTLLHQCQVGGLQVCKDGKWITVKPRRGAIVVNVGDNLQAWTNGRFRSVEHRAVLNDQVPRVSLVFFYAPPFDTVIRAPEAIVQADGKRRYRDFTWGEFLEFLKKHNFEKGKHESWLHGFAL